MSALTNPAPTPGLARLTPALLQVLAAGGTATEIYYGQRYGLRIYDAQGRPEWTSPGWLYAWQQLRERGWAERRRWVGNRAEYGISATGREFLEALGG